MSTELSDVIVTTTEVMDWQRMGEFLAEQDQNDQASALLGFWSNMCDEQILYIASSHMFGGSHESTRQEVADFYRALADAIEEGGR